MERKRQVPLYMIYGTHDKRGRHGLNIFADYIKSLLASNSVGKVGIFIENASGTMAESGFISGLVLQGELPTDANAHVQFVLRHGRRTTSREELNQWKFDYLPGMDPWIRHQYRRLDAIAKEHPGRLYLMEEWQTDQTINQVIDEDGRNRELMLKREALEKAYSGDFASSLPVFQQASDLGVKNGSTREQNILKMIKEELPEENFAGLVGFIGAVHTGISHDLRRNGYNIRSIFIERIKGRFTYDPFSVAVRQRMFFPERQYSQDEWMKILTITVLYEVVDVLARDQTTYTKYTKQEFCQMLWKVAKNLTPQDVRNFEYNIKQKGVLKACEDFFTNYDLI